MFDAELKTSAGSAGSIDRLVERFDRLLAAGMTPDPEAVRELQAMARIYDLDAERPPAEVWNDLRAVLARQAPETAVPADPLTVLVVEDDPDLAGDLMQALTEAGHGVVGPFAQAEAAAAAAQQQPVDVALVDINLGGALSGVDLVRRLKASWGVPAVFTSGDVPNAARNAGLAAAVVLKPYSTQQILGALALATR